MSTLNPAPRRLGRVRRISKSAVVLPWRAVSRTWLDLVWADLRDGTLSLRGLSLGTRSLIWLGFGLLVAALGLVVANDLIRAQFPMMALRSSVTGRGSLVPIPLVPLTLFLVAISWAFILTGALHAHRLIRLGSVLLYVALTVGWLDQSTIGDPLDKVQSAAAILLVPVFFAVRWRAAPRPVIEFPLILLATALTYISFQSQGAESVRITGVDLLLAHLNGEILSLTLLILPLLALAGMGVATFARQAGGWTVDVACCLLPGRAMRAVLALFLAWRLYDVVTGALSRVEMSSPGSAALAYAGALLVPLAVLAAWLLTRRPHPQPLRGANIDSVDVIPIAMERGATRNVQVGSPCPPRWGGTSAQVLSELASRRMFAPRSGQGVEPTSDAVVEAADRHAMRVILTFVAPQLAGFLLLTLVVPAAALGLVPHEDGQAFLTTSVGALNSDAMNLSWRLLVAMLAVAAGTVLTRRGHGGLALFLAVFGLTAAHKELTVPSAPLGLLAPYGGLGGLVDLWWVLSFGLFALVWLVRGRLTDDRVGGLLLLLLVSWLLGQTDFISNRFSPFFGSGGIWFIAFSLAWDALTIGAWANVSSPTLPRVSRILLYLGYSLLTVAVVNWAVSVHDLTAMNRLTGEAALDGLERYGRPMLYAIFAVTLAAAPSRMQPRSEIP